MVTSNKNGSVEQYVDCVMWEEGQTHVIDTVGMDGRTTINDLSLGQVRTRENNQNINIVKWDVVEKFIEKHNKETYLDAKTKTISEEEFENKLNCLPPCRHMNQGGIEYFHISEHITDGVVSWYTRTNDECKTFYASPFISEGEIYSKMEEK